MHKILQCGFSFIYLLNTIINMKTLSVCVIIRIRKVSFAELCIFINKHCRVIFNFVIALFPYLQIIAVKLFQLPSEPQ